MYIKSTINPRTRSNVDVPIILLRYEKVKKFVSRPKTYEDVIRVIREKFSVEHDASIVLMTSTLDICQWSNAEIDESAYEAMCAFLDEVIVVTSPATKYYPGTNLRVSSAVDVTKWRSNEGTVTLQLAGAVVEPVKSKESPTLSVSTSAVEKVAGNIQKNDIHDGEEDGKTLEPEAVLCDLRKKDAKDKLVKGGKSTEGVTRARPVGMVVEYESEEDLVEGGWRTDVAPYSYDVVSAHSTDAEDADTGSDSDVHKVEHVRPPMQVAKEDSPSQRKDRSVDKPIQKELTPSNKPASKEDSSINDPQPSSQQSQAKPDPRFKIYIWGPYAGRKVEMLTRGRHPVTKVLSVACNKFGIDHTRARLMLAVNIPDESGTTVEHRFECSKGATMSKSGVTEGAKLVVELDDYYDDE